MNVGDREKVADVIEREMDFVIHDWMGMVEKQEDLMHISLNRDERTDHLPQLLRDVIARSVTIPVITELGTLATRMESENGKDNT